MYKSAPIYNCYMYRWHGYEYVSLFVICCYLYSMLLARHICATGFVLIISLHSPCNIVNYSLFVSVLCLSDDTMSLMLVNVSDLQACLFVQDVSIVNRFILCDERVI